MLRNFIGGIKFVMNRHGGGEGVKKWANWRYVINEWPQNGFFNHKIVWLIHIQVSLNAMRQ